MKPTDPAVLSSHFRDTYHGEPELYERELDEPFPEETRDPHDRKSLDMFLEYMERGK